jgi:hypothetical protein
MTADTLPAATGQSRRRSRRRGVVPWIALAVLVALTVTAVVIAAPRGGNPLDPRSPTPEGSRAIAELLRSRGIPVTRVTTVAAAPVTDTFVVPYPSRLDDADLGLLRDATGAVILIDPSQQDLTSLGLQLTTGDQLSIHSRAPGCALPAAVTAGTVSAGGTAFGVIGGPATQRCYDDTLARVDRYTVLGAGSFLTNERLDQDGNAALALGLLDRNAPVAWVLPTGGQPNTNTSGDALVDHLPRGLRVGILQLFFAVFLLALARGRRLGPPVAEQLPVSVRAAETVEGRARLYRAARARSAAADALREGARRRFASRLTPGPGSVDAATLVRAVATRTGRDPGEVASLLYGPGSAGDGRAAAPLDDAGLLRLSDELETLDRQVRRT